MRTTVAAGFAFCLLAGSYVALAQAPGGAAPPPRPAPPPRMPMTFFVASVGLGKGGDLGGLAGADAHCQKLAMAAATRRGILPKKFRAAARRRSPGLTARDCSTASPSTEAISRLQPRCPGLGHVVAGLCPIDTARAP